MTKHLWLIRHSESQGNFERRIQGWVDYPLTPRGRGQAERLAERMAGVEGIRHLVASPLMRAAETAEAVGRALDLPVVVDDSLREYGFGPLSGMTRPEIAERHPRVWAAWEVNEFWEALPGEEGEPAFEARVRRAMDAVVATVPEGGGAAVVTHAGALNICLRSWLGIVDRGWRTFAFDNASVSLVELQPAERRAGDEAAAGHNYRLLLLNDTSHLGELAGGRPAWFSAARVPATGNE